MLGGNFGSLLYGDVSVMNAVCHSVTSFHFGLFLNRNERKCIVLKNFAGLNNAA